MPHGSAGSYAGGATGNVVLNATSTIATPTDRQAFFDLNGSTQTINGLSNTATFPASNCVESLAAGGHLMLGDNNATAEFGGVIRNGAGSMSITKIGGGTQTFSGDNTYTGTTSVNAGTLLVNGSHAGAGSYTVANGATLGGSGSLAFGAGASLTVDNGGILAPGASIGALTLDGSAAGSPLLTFAGGAILGVQLDNPLAADKVALVNGAAGDILFGGNTINFTDLSGGSLTLGQYTLFAADVATAYAGLSTDGGGFITGGLAIGTGLSAYSSSLQVVGNDIVVNIAAIPEPATMLLSVAALLALAATRRGRATNWI